MDAFNSLRSPDGEPLPSGVQGEVEGDRGARVAQGSARRRRPLKGHAPQDRLPHHGLLEFDYVVLRPREGLPLPSRDFRLDLADPADRAVSAFAHMFRVYNSDADSY